jgi:hypothetical protein
LVVKSALPALHVAVYSLPNCLVEDNRAKRTDYFISAYQRMMYSFEDGRSIRTPEVSGFVAVGNLQKRQTYGMTFAVWLVNSSSVTWQTGCPPEIRDQLRS